jgi:polyisoprenoid-binding protein YceI
MATFNVLSQESPVSVDAQTTGHPVHAESHALSGTVDVELDEQGHPNLAQPYSAHLQVPVETLRSGHNLQDREMHRRLDTRHFPDITVDLTEVTPAEETEGHYRAKARLSVRGQTQEVEGDVTLSVDGDRIVIEGEKTIDMRSFGVAPPNLIVLRVAPEVGVRVRVTAQRQA